MYIKLYSIHCVYKTIHSIYYAYKTIHSIYYVYEYIHNKLNVKLNMSFIKDVFIYTINRLLKIWILFKVCTNIIIYSKQL